MPASRFLKICKKPAKFQSAVSTCQFLLPRTLLYGICHIGERIIRGCASALLRVCNMIELVHAKLTHIYAATRRLSGMHVGRATMILSVSQICWSLLKKGLRGVMDSPENMQFGRLHNLMTPAKNKIV